MPGVNYLIKVSAYNAVGEGAQSAELTIMAAAIPDAPTSIAKVSQSATSISISWVAPYSGGTPITTYKIWWDDGLGGASSTFVQKVGSTGLVTTYTLNSGVVTDKVYQIAVRAANAIGDGPLSSSISIRAASIPDAPSSPTKLASTTSSISI